MKYWYTMPKIEEEPIIESSALMVVPSPKKRPGKKVGMVDRPGIVRKNKGATQVSRVVPRMTDAQILDAKVEILRLLSDGLALNITEAARKLNLLPARVYTWAKTDPDFKELIKAVDEVIADQIESDFLKGRNDVPKMMLLKGKRPQQYRDNFKIEYSTEKVESYLKELKELAQKNLETR